MPDRHPMVRSRFCGLFWVSRVTGLKVNLSSLKERGRVNGGFGGLWLSAGVRDGVSLFPR